MPWAETTGELRKELRASIADGAAFSVMVGCGESYLPAFVLAVGHGEVAAGLTGTIPLLTGAVLQLASPPLVRRWGSHRRWVLLCGIVQALAFAPLAVAAWVGRVPWVIVLLIATIYWGSGMAAGPAWNTWMGRVVPVRTRARFFATRTRITQIFVLVSLLASGAFLQKMDSRGKVLAGFVALFALSGLFRLISAGCLALQSEAPPGHADERSVSFGGLWQRRRTPAGRLLWYMVCVQVATHFAAAYFTPYMLQKLELPYMTYVILLAASFLAKVLALPSLGRLAHHFGAKRLLWIGGMGIVPLGWMWMISGSVPYLLVIQLFAGAAWGAYELATFLMVIETIPDTERTSVLTMFNLLNALAIVAGSLVGGYLLRVTGEVPFSYMLLFLISSGGRLLTLPLLSQVSEVRLAAVLLGLRTLAVRPSAGSIDGPIVPPEPADGNAD